MIGSFQTNPAGLTGSLGTAGTASLGNPFGTTTGLGSTSLTSGSTFGTPLGTNTLGATGLGATTGFGPRVLREDLIPLLLGPPQEELLAPPGQD